MAADLATSPVETHALFQGFSEVPAPREDNESLATVLPFRRDKVEVTGDGYYYAPLESAELQAMDTMRHYLGEVVTNLLEDTESRRQMREAGKREIPRGYPASIVSDYAIEAKAADIAFWGAYKKAVGDRNN
ncbi:MAG TPA: hypothetical protein VG604_00235 [Candidatus Saccharimonadales bacterium]|nr:hypothetical protein [Candidatus Saccharimonadales bacterium]